MLIPPARWALRCIRDTYTYGDADWKDKLTAFNGKNITYDAIGNPLKDNTWLIR